MRAVHVTETDAIARAEAEQPLLTSRGSGERGSRTCIGVKGTEKNPMTRDIHRVFQGMRTSNHFGLDYERLLVGSPETVIHQRKAQHQRLGDDVFCGNHRLGIMAPERH